MFVSLQYHVSIRYCTYLLMILFAILFSCKYPRLEKGENRNVVRNIQVVLSCDFGNCVFLLFKVFLLLMQQIISHCGLMLNSQTFQERTVSWYGFLIKYLVFIEKYMQLFLLFNQYPGPRGSVITLLAFSSCANNLLRQLYKMAVHNYKF